MAYIRFAFEDSDVYLINTVTEQVRVIACMACRRGGKKGFATVPGILAHLDEHRAAGDCVPECAYENIIRRGEEWLDGS